MKQQHYVALRRLIEGTVANPKGPGAQIVYTLAPKYLYRDYFEAKVYLFGYMDP